MFGRDFTGGPVVKTLSFSNEGSMGSSPGWETKIPHAVGCSRPPPPRNRNKENPIKDVWPRKTMFPEVQHCPSVTFRFKMMDGGVCRSDHLVKE